MKVVCAWCQKTLQEPPDGEPGVSHGICEDCLHRVMGTRPRELGELLRTLEVPVMVLDSRSRVVDMNESAEKALGTSRAAAVGALTGPAISCYNAGLPGGCGLSEHCPGCALRQKLAATHADGQPRFGQISEHDIVRDGRSRTVRFRFSTHKAGDLVMLLLEEVTGVVTIF